MTTDNLKPDYRVPEPTLRRLPWYLAYLQLLQSRGETYVSSTLIAKEINVDSSQVAKDLSIINISGKTRVGYEIDTLICVLEKFLGFNAQHKAIVFGVGNLGGALIHDSGLQQFGLEIIAGFDTRDDKAGKIINGVPVYYAKEFPALQKELLATICILTVPVEHAQFVTDKVVAEGIKAIWNFTPFRIRVPGNIVVKNTSMFAHLAVMYNRMNTISDSNV